VLALRERMRFNGKTPWPSQQRTMRGDKKGEE
jgi:hypothetical protein